MDLHLERIGPFVLLPVIHHSYEFTVAARAAFSSLQPCGVGLEYPASLQDLILQGIKRLPRISILMYGNRLRRYIRIEPVDAFAEAARCALQADVPIKCLDLELEEYPDIQEPYPDTYAIQRIGHRKYSEMILNGYGRIRTEADERRERAMAFYLQDWARKLKIENQEVDHPILVLCGMAHLDGLTEQLSIRQAQPYFKPPRARLYHLSSNSLGEIMGQFPFLTAVYELQRTGNVQPPDAPQEMPNPLPDQGLQLIEGKKINDFLEFVKRAHLATAASVPNFDRHEMQMRFTQWSRSHYEKEAGDILSPQQILLLGNFVRKYANEKSMLLPDFYELLIAARNCINSHFCYRMWEVGTSYPAQLGPSEIEIIELRAEDLFQFVSKVRMNPFPPLRPRATLPRFLRRRDKQRDMKNKDLQFSPFTICSYQPEDLAIESYGNYLRTKGKSMLSEERKRVQPFETSLLDGIDLRETIRNFHTGQIFVQECRNVKGEVDSLVVIFDEDVKPYPFSMTWLGEHHQESDMAFYSTDPDEKTVGPGIRKGVYGGFLMTMPPGRLYDVFHDPAYHFAENHAERLLLAAIDYGLEKFVLYAAHRPPRPYFQTIAGRYGKRILYIPLAQLSPVMLQKIRNFHILSEKSVREYAKDYIW
jgi:hypothetical protein